VVERSNQNKIEVRSPCNGLVRRVLHIGNKEAGARVAAIVSIVETCRRLNIPIGDYLSSVLPGLAKRPISQTAELTSAAWANRNASATPPTLSAVYLVRRLLSTLLFAASSAYPRLWFEAEALFN